MARPRPPQASPRRSRKVIDVGEGGAAGDDAAEAGAADGDGEGGAGEDDPEAIGVELGAAGVIDLDPVVDEEPAGADGDEAALVAPAATARSTSLSRRDPMAQYMSEARRFPLLTPDEEHALAVRLREHGDTKAARRMVEANLRLVVKIAYEYRRAHHNLLDMVQEGNIGLIQAVAKFDPYRGVKLSSYAAFWIRAYILKFILNNWRLVKIGTTQAQRKLFFNLRKERERLEQLGFAPTSKLLADRLDVSERDVIEMERRLAAPEASLDAPVGGEDDQRTRLDAMPSEDTRPDRAVADSEFAQLLKAKISTFVDTLDGRDKTILQERWLADPPLTLQEIGDRYGISRERARQIETRVLARLKKFLEAEFGGAVDIGQLVRE